MPPFPQILGVVALLILSCLFLTFLHVFLHRFFIHLITLMGAHRSVIVLKITSVKKINFSSTCSAFFRLPCFRVIQCTCDVVYEMYWFCSCNCFSRTPFDISSCNKSTLLCGRLWQLKPSQAFFLELYQCFEKLKIFVEMY